MYCAGRPDEEHHAGDEIGAEAQHAPRQQPMHVRKRHLPHHAEDPQVHGQQYADRQRHAEEVHRLAGRRGPRAVDHELRDGRCHESFAAASRRAPATVSVCGAARISGCRISPPRFAARPMMTIETTSSSVAAATRPRAATAAAPRLPQREPRDEAGELDDQMNPQSATSWWSLIAMSDTPGASRSSRYAASAADVRGQRQQRDHVEGFQPGVRQVLVPPDEGQQQQPERGHRADRRHVVEQQVQVVEAHGWQIGEQAARGDGRGPGDDRDDGESDECCRRLRLSLRRSARSGESARPSPRWQ